MTPDLLSSTFLNWPTTLKCSEKAIKKTFIVSFIDNHYVHLKLVWSVVDFDESGLMSGGL
jgi:hypothetical protein